jgi:hypothetical protein
MVLKAIVILGLTGAAALLAIVLELYEPGEHG